MNNHDQAELPVNHEIVFSAQLQTAMQLAQGAGPILMKYHRTNLAVDYKRDAFDPVSAADRESDDFLRAGIAAAFPDDEILSEENPLQPTAYDKRVWFVDPLDDSKGYLAGDTNFSIMISLWDGERGLVMGTVYFPGKEEWYYAEAGKGAFHVLNGETTRLQVASVTDIEDAVLVGRKVLPGDIRPIEDVVARLGFKQTIPGGSVGQKIGWVADGTAHASIHTNLKAGKWDTGASDIILREAGGPPLRDIDGRPLDYTKPDSGWDRYFVGACTPELLDRMIADMREINETAHSF